MKKLFFVAVVGLALASCGETTPAGNNADSLKNAVENTGDSVKQVIDSSASAAKDSVNASVDTTKAKIDSVKH